MAAATLPISTPELPTGIFHTVPLAAGANIPAGVLVALNAAGYAVNAANTANLRIIGRAEASADNTGGADGAVSLDTKRGVFKFSNSAGSAVTIARIGLPVMVEDNQTVATAASQSIKAGIAIRIDSDGVWVDTSLAPTV